MMELGGEVRPPPTRASISVSAGLLAGFDHAFWDNERLNIALTGNYAQFARFLGVLAFLSIAPGGPLPRGWCRHR